ncbi:unnamed protein product [Amoebophrya sp. A25]|nr:unnamed protein product [Amoebophrya sp. A25]|eukprot:GSA25T00017696001.1
MSNCASSRYPLAGWRRRVSKPAHAASVAYLRMLLACRALLSIWVSPSAGQAVASAAVQIPIAAFQDTSHLHHVPVNILSPSTPSDLEQVRSLPTHGKAILDIKNHWESDRSHARSSKSDLTDFGYRSTLRRTLGEILTSSKNVSRTTASGTTSQQTRNAHIPSFKSDVKYRAVVGGAGAESGEGYLRHMRDLYRFLSPRFGEQGPDFSEASDDDKEPPTYAKIDGLYRNLDKANFAFIENSDFERDSILHSRHVFERDDWVNDFDFSKLHEGQLHSASASSSSERIRRDPGTGASATRASDAGSGADADSDIKAKALENTRRYFDFLRRMDAIGDPPFTPDFGDPVGRLSPCMLGYAKQVFEMEIVFGTLSGFRIAEIGVGFGGLAHALFARFLSLRGREEDKNDRIRSGEDKKSSVQRSPPPSYTLIDLPEAEQLAFRVLRETIGQEIDVDDRVKLYNSDSQIVLKRRADELQRRIWRKDYFLAKARAKEGVAVRSGNAQDSVQKSAATTSDERELLGNDRIEKFVEGDPGESQTSPAEVVHDDSVLMQIYENTIQAGVVQRAKHTPFIHLVNAANEPTLAQMAKDIQGRRHRDQDRAAASLPEEIVDASPPIEDAELQSVSEDQELWFASTLEENNEPSLELANPSVDLRDAGEAIAAVEAWQRGRGKDRRHEPLGVHSLSSDSDSHSRKSTTTSTAGVHFDYDLCISNYAFNELVDEALAREYVDNILARCKRVWISWGLAGADTGAAFGGLRTSKWQIEIFKAMHRFSAVEVKKMMYRRWKEQRLVGDDLLLERDVLDSNANSVARALEAEERPSNEKQEARTNTTTLFGRRSKDLQKHLALLARLHHALVPFFISVPDVPVLGGSVWAEATNRVLIYMNPLVATLERGSPIYNFVEPWDWYTGFGRRIGLWYAARTRAYGGQVRYLAWKDEKDGRPMVGWIRGEF